MIMTNQQIADTLLRLDRQQRAGLSVSREYSEYLKLWDARGKALSDKRDFDFRED